MKSASLGRKLMTAIAFLIDENVPFQAIIFLRDRGHTVDYVGERFAKSSPDALLVAAAEEWGYVVVTFDADFKRLIRQVPHGQRTKFSKQAGRLSLTMDETEVLPRLIEMIAVIEVLYAAAQALGKRFTAPLSLTSITSSV